MVDNSVPFTNMADRIKHNEDAKFGGAVVLIPPTGDPIELLMLDAQGDQAQFWSTILSRIQVIMNQLQEKERIAQGFGRR
jgi:hypothetical protein